MKKLFVFDVDGTIVTNYKDISKGVINCLNKLLKDGHVVAIASGRPYIGIAHFLSMLTGDNKFCICANGAEVTDFDGNTLFSSMLKMQEYYNFYEKHKHILDDKDTNIYCYTHRGIAFFKNDFWIDMESKCNADLPRIDLNQKLLKPDHNILKIMVASSKDVSFNLEKNEFNEEKEKYRMVRTSDYFLEFINKNTDKATGVSFLKKYLKIKSNNDIYTFGDSGNDVLMIKSFNGIAMGNATNECKSVAKFVTKDVNEDGVVYAIRHYCKL